MIVISVWIVERRPTVPRDFSRIIIFHVLRYNILVLYREQYIKTLVVQLKCEHAEYDLIVLADKNEIQRFQRAVFRHFSCQQPLWYDDYLSAKKTSFITIRSDHKKQTIFI